MAEEPRLEALRARIDALDQELLKLISARGACAREVGQIKQQAGAANFYRPEREAEVLRGVLAANPGPLPDATLAHLYRELISACRALEQPLAVAYLGPEGTFSEEAVRRQFGQAVTGVPVGSIEEVFREVDAGGATYGVVPIENSTEGAVTHTLDLLQVAPLRICGELELPIHQNLMAHGGTLAGIRQVYTHQQSLAQCRRWLLRHLPGVPVETVASNAEAARRAAQEPNSAAVAGMGAAQRYGLTVLATRIEDQPGNTTRFLVIGHQQTRPTGRDKTSLLIELGDAAATRSGALLELLEPLRAHDVSMLRIESRPARSGRWEYVFFVDLEGHSTDAPLAAALRELETIAARVTVLGAYPRAIVQETA